MNLILKDVIPSLITKTDLIKFLGEEFVLEKVHCALWGLVSGK